MLKCGKWPVAVCSWSFRKSVEEIGSVMTALGLEHINLAIAPALAPDGEAYLDAVRKQGWTVTAGMMNYDYEDYSTLDTIKVTGGIAPDAHWPASGEAFARAAQITAALGSQYIMMHVGFLDHTDNAYAKKFYDRVRALGDSAGEAGVTLLMETGQETAEELQRFVETLNHPNVLLNFDPANLILYNKDEPLPHSHQGCDPNHCARHMGERSRVGRRAGQCFRVPERAGGDRIRGCRGHRARGG